MSSGSVGLLVVGAPRGAGADLASVLALLPQDFSVPVVVVLHRGPADLLAEPLARQCALPVVEPDDKDELLPGRVYLAPAGYHLLVDRGSVCLSVEPPEHRQRPAIDPLLESAADAYGPAAAALLFAGHEDGWEGLSALRQRGGRAVVVGGGEGGDVDGEVEHLPLSAVGGWLSRLGCAPRMKVVP
jgi:two-component system chemotaxis response regulator CheB